MTIDTPKAVPVLPAPEVASHHETFDLHEAETVTAMGDLAKAPLLHREPEVGDRIGWFRLVELLGRGGMASVFRAEHVTLKGQVALKILQGRYQGHERALHRFFKEAQAVRAVNHPAIREVTDIIRDEEHPPCIVMRLLEGEDLARYLHRTGPLSPRKAVDITAQLCDAVAAIHKLDIIHRDLKPHNLFIVEGEDGPEVKLLDFGLAKFLSTSEDPFINTRTGDVLGTPAFMAPEQVRGQAVDHRTDIYAIGVILYAILTGAPPFAAEHMDDLLRLQLEEEPEPPSKRDPRVGSRAISQAIDDIVLRCLAKDPNDRISDAVTIKTLLENALDPTAPFMLPPRPAVRRRRGAGWIWLAAVALGGAVVALASWQIFG